MIIIKNISKAFNDKNVINDVSLSIQPGITALIGKNGSGKSTLLRLISNIYHLDNGEIYIDGYSYTSLEAKRLSFFLSDNPYYFPSGYIKDTLRYYECLFPLDKKVFDHLINRFSLPNDKRLITFSKGMIKLLFIAISFSVKTPYLLLDEPLDGVDVIAIDEIKKMIIELCNDKTIIISSHNVEILKDLAEYFIFVKEGKVILNGTLDDITSHLYKYQVIFDHEIDISHLKKDIPSIIDVKKTGSIYYLIAKEEINESMLTNYPHHQFTNIDIDIIEAIRLEIGDNDL